MKHTVAEVTPPVRSAHTDLDVSLVSGIAWTSGMKWFAQLLSWGCMIAVARLLAPADFGLVGMAALYLELVTIVSELALGAAVVTKHSLSVQQIAQLNSLSVILGMAAFLVSCAAAIPLSIFFGAAELRWVVLAMSLSSVVTSFRAVPSALLERELQFRTLALIEGVQAVIAAVSILIMAQLGFRYWALVVGSLVGKMVWTGLVLVRRVHAFAWPRLRALREPIAFSSHLLASRVAWYAQANSDFLVAGRVFGKELLGAYAMSFTMANLPTEKITSIMGQVAFPLFSAVQNDRAALRRYLLLMTKGFALLTFPLAFGLALVADELILGVLGPRWEAAINPLRCLAFLTLIKSVVPLLPQVLNVAGESRYAMRVGVVVAVVMPLAFFVGSHWGILGIAAVWVSVYPVTTIPLYSRVFNILDLSAVAYLKALWPAVSASVIMATAVWLLKQTVPYGYPMARLTLQVVVGGAVYSLMIATLHRQHLNTLHQALRLIRDSRRS